MKIIKLESNNILRLKAVEITPEGNTVVIGGSNGAGKSSVLNSIAMAFGGGKEIPEEPVNRTKTKAQIIVQTDRLTITRKFNKGKTTLEVRNANGDKIKSPQAILDELVGAIAFDPLAFAEYDSKKQLEVAKKLVGADTTEIDRQRQNLYGTRTDVKRDAKEAEVQLNDCNICPEITATEEQSAKDLIDELEQAMEHNAANDEKRTEVDAMREEAVKVRKEIEEKQKYLDTLVETGKELAANLEKLEDKNVPEIRDRLDKIEENNAKIRENAKYLKAKKRFEALAKQCDDLSAEITALDKSKEAIIAGSNFPVDGLGFSDVGIIYNGLPFEQASTAERLKISVAIGIALNPELKVLLIRDGSHLDDDNLKLVAKMAEENDAQIWIERVGKGKECSVIIEDGEIEKE